MRTEEKNKQRMETDREKTTGRRQDRGRNETEKVPDSGIKREGERDIDRERE